MSGWEWGSLSLVIGLVIVVLAVGVPYFFTHKRMRDPRDVSDSRAYLRSRRRWVWRRASAGLPPGATRPGDREPTASGSGSPAGRPGILSRGEQR